MKTNSTLLKVVSLIAVAALSLAACGGQATAKASAVPKTNAAPTQATTAQKQPTTASPQPTASKEKPTEVKPTATQAKPTEAPTKVPTSEPATSMEPTGTAVANEPLIPVGTPQATEGLNVTPKGIEWVSKTGTEEAPKGNIFLVVTISLENTSKTASTTFDPAELSLVGPSNTVIQLDALKSVSNELKSQTLKPGQKVEGVAVFEVPQKDYADKWMLELKTGNNQTLQWSLAG